MSSLSVVVLRLGSDLDFETTLASVLRYRLPHHQVTAVTSPEQFRDYGLEDEVDFAVCEEPASYWNFLKCATRSASGENLIALMPGVEVHHQWFAAGIRALRAERSVCASFSIRSEMPGSDRLIRGIGLQTGYRPCFVSSAGANLAGPSFWAVAWRVDVLRELANAMDPICDSLAPLEFALAAGRQGWSCVSAENSVLTISGALPGALASPFLLGQYATRLQHRYAIRPPSALARLRNGLRIISGLVTPAGWMFAAGRRLANRMREQDLEYAARLASHGSAEVNGRPTAKDSRLRAA